MKRLILFLIRRKLKLRKYEKFRFINQKSKDNYYYFNNYGLMKVEYRKKGVVIRRPSNVKFNFLISDSCEIEKFFKLMCVGEVR